ncbi:MAG: cysteine desulfurase family protein [Lachnospiraceae bacterium]|nr:cysteine desulfurase family protein [Lachnospiraceae bacterium]
MTEIYFDNAATQPLKPEVLTVMMPYLTEHFGNPSAIYRSAQKARNAVALAREKVASLLNCRPDEIFFTSGGTEADNWALATAFEAHQADKPHIITTAIEHHAVLETCHYLEKRGAEVTYVPVNSSGRVDPEVIREAIRPETGLISVMSANNETGILQPVAEIGAIAHENGILFHTDAVQAAGHVPLDLQTLPVDLLSISAHKMGGPKGVGCLFIRRGVSFGGFIHGGAQEKDRRAGTENVAGIVGFGEAAALAKRDLEENARYVTALRDRLVSRLSETVPDITFNGTGERLPGHVNVTCHGTDGESLLIFLDMQGLACSAGSACASGSLSPSHVLTAMGLSYEDAHATIRLTLSENNMEAEIDEAAAIIAKAVALQRTGAGF